MASEGNWAQSLSDKKYQYFGSSRNYYTGSTIGSTSTWTFFNFSGTNTGFGPANNVLSNRITLVASGTSLIEWSYNSGASTAGILWGDAFAQDGVNVSGLWIRSNAATQVFRLWAW